MNATTYLELLAERARLAEAARSGPPADRFAARVWGKVAEVRYRASAAPDATPLLYLMGGAAVAATVMLAWSASVWNALTQEAAAPSFVQDLFNWM